MPVYNGAPFLEETLNSLRNQSYKNFELICIDDGSTDNSLEILKKFQKENPFLKVFCKPNEGTAAKAVNFGLEYAVGEYFMYSSQDDLYSENLLKINYELAKELNADAVVPNTIFYTDTKDTDEGIFGLNNNYEIVLSGKEAFSYSLNWEISGFVLWRRSLLKNIGNKFFDFSLNGDEYTTRMLYYYSNKVVFSKENFYYRQNNPNSITKKWNTRLLESFDTTSKLENFVRENTNSKNDLIKVSQTLYFELLRISSIFYKNRSTITKTEFKNVENRLVNIYEANRNDFKKFKFDSMLQKLQKAVVLISYSSLKYSHLLIQVLKK